MQIVSVSEDRCIRIWEQMGKLWQEGDILGQHKNPVNSVVFYPGGKKVGVGRCGRGGTRCIGACGGMQLRE